MSTCNWCGDEIKKGVWERKILSALPDPDFSREFKYFPFEIHTCIEEEA